MAKFKRGDVVEYHHESYPDDHSVYYVKSHDEGEDCVTCIPIVEMNSDAQKQYKELGVVYVDADELRHVRRDDGESR